MNKELILDQIKKVIDNNNIYLNEPLKNHTTFKVGGPADIFVVPHTYEELRDVYKIAKENNIDCYILGNGSNILCRDGGFRGIVIKTENLNNITVNGNNVTAQTGAMLKAVSDKCSDNMLTGFEFASGIPGSIGGAVTMNAGAYGGEMKDILHECKVIDNDFEIRTLTLEEAELGYRTSIIQKKHYVVLEATFALQKGSSEEINEVVADLTKKREEKQPLDDASAGSTFKRPEGYFAGKLIQDSGLKGFSLGRAQVSAKHSGFIINKGGATAKELLDLIAHVQKTVYDKFGVKLETEVRIIGED